jgi:RNA polymerase sigma factor (sigma-70 family)
LNDDARVLDQIRRGDEEALVRLYEICGKQVTAFVTRNSGTHDDAEDLLQEALVVLWERVRANRYEQAARISTFVFATVRNMWMRRLARTRREVVTELGDGNTMSNDLSALDEMIESEEAALVNSALEKLGNPCKQLLLLYYWEELSMDEIARTMGFANAETVKSKKYQCKKALAGLMKQFHEH